MRTTIVELFLGLVMTAVLIFSAVWLVKSVRVGVAGFGADLSERIRRRSARKKILGLASPLSREELEELALVILVGVPCKPGSDEFFTDLRVRRSDMMRRHFKSLSDEKLLIAVEEKIRETSSEELKRMLKHLESRAAMETAYVTDPGANT